MLESAYYYNLDKNMTYGITKFHDIGLNINRENHKFEFWKILENDKKLFSNLIENSFIFQLKIYNYFFFLIR